MPFRQSKCVHDRLAAMMFVANFDLMFVANFDLINQVLLGISTPSMAEEMKGSTARQLFEAMAQPVVPTQAVAPSQEDSTQAVAPPVEAVAPSDSTQAVAPSVDDASNELQPVVPILAVAPSQEDSTQAIAPPVEAVAPSGEVVALSGDDKR